MASFEIEWKHSAARELRKLPREVIARIIAAVETLGGRSASDRFTQAGRLRAYLSYSRRSLSNHLRGWPARFSHQSHKGGASEGSLSRSLAGGYEMQNEIYDAIVVGSGATGG